MGPLVNGDFESRGNGRPQANTHLPLSSPHPITNKTTFHGWYFRRASSPGSPTTWTRYHKVPMAYSSDELGRMVRQSLAATAKAKRPARSAAEQYHLLGDHKKDMVDELIGDVRSRENCPGDVWTLACVTQDARPVVKRSGRGRGELVRTEDARQVDVILKREVDRDAGPRMVQREDSPVDAAAHVSHPVHSASPVDVDGLPPLDDHALRPKGILKSSKPPAPALPPYPTDDGERVDYPPVFPPAVQPPPPIPLDSSGGFPPPPPPTQPGARHAVLPGRAPESPRAKMPNPPYPPSPPPIPSVPVTSRPSARKVEETQRQAKDRTRVQPATMLDLVDTDSSDSEDDLPPPPPPMPQPKTAKHDRSSRSTAYEFRSQTAQPARTPRQQRHRASKRDSSNPNIVNITMPDVPSSRRAPRERGRRRSRSRSRSRSIESLSVRSKRSTQSSRSRNSRRSSSTVSTRVRTILSSTASEGYDSPPPPPSASRSPRKDDDDAAVYIRVPLRREERRRRRSRSRDGSRSRDVYRWPPHPPRQHQRQRSPSPLPHHGSRYYHDNGSGAL
ncbi:uncharacterized protein IWZ02DRAFT_491331 [Phyllosticta citriasiana]|uniref:uncharacterized protein n=1 Tax=Phyllosticta citriasiana TaxID=595635 RepID=UPI0030FD5B11